MEAAEAVDAEEESRILPRPSEASSTAPEAAAGPDDPAPEPAVSAADEAPESSESKTDDSSEDEPSEAETRKD